MSLLTKNSLPAERKRNLSFAENFVNAQEVRENGGRLRGDPSVDFGTTLDGTNDYISYTLDVSELRSATISILIRFAPDFAYDEDAIRYLIDTTNGAEFSVVKNNNAGSNTLDIVLGDTAIASIASATYSDYWDVGVENILVVSGTTTDTSAWLNGVQILTEDNTAWSAAAPAALYVGAEQAGGSTFDGVIYEVKTFKVQLTDQEALNYSNGDWTSYRNQTALDCPLDLANHDLENLVALDISGNGYHLNFGTGSEATRPTKNTTEQGYAIDGNDFFDNNSGIGITGFPFTMSLMFRTTSAGLVGVIDLADTASGTRNMGIYLNTDEVVQVHARNPNFYPAGTIQGDNGNWIHAVCTFISATERSLYINGEYNATATDSAAFFAPDRFTVGRFGDLTPSANFTGDAAKVKVWNDRALTPLQIWDLALRDIKQINNI